MANSLLNEVTKLLLENDWEHHSITTTEKNNGFEVSPLVQEVYRGFEATFEKGSNLLTVSLRAHHGSDGHIIVSRTGIRVVQIDLDGGFPCRVIPTLSLVLEIIKTNQREH